LYYVTIQTHDIFLPGGRVGPSPLMKINKVEIFLMETLILQIGFRLSSDIFSRMYLYWKQIATKNYFDIKYSLYFAYVVFRDFIDSFKNVGGAQTIETRINFQEVLFNLEHSGKASLPSRTRRFKTPPMPLR